MVQPDIFTEDREEVMVMEDISSGEVSHLIIYNDDFNTFDWVIQSLIEICGHSSEQAEQLSLIIHFKGKATTKTGSFERLLPLKDALVERGLSAVIETEVNK